MERVRTRRPRSNSARDALHARLLEREQSEHFQSLPPAFQAELRDRSKAELARFDGRYADRKRYVARSAAEGAVLLFLGKLLFGWSAVALVLAPVLGAATGVVWYLTRARRFLCMAQVIPAFLLLAVVGKPSFLTFFEAVFVLTAAAALGSVREFRLGDDSVM